MKSKQPPFEITHQIIDSVAQIAELVGRLTAVSSLPANPTLRRSNRIRTIHRQTRSRAAQRHCRGQKCL